MSAKPDRPEGCPERPADLTRESLGFERRSMVRWLNPPQLLDTAMRVALSMIFGEYADKREVEPALGHAPVDRSLRDRSEVWIDYTADLGDGFDSTYTIASLLAQQKLELDGNHATRRADVLVMGGDQVYPTAKRSEYQTRTIQPYAAALPCAPEDDRPTIFAIPGNHDWYDGLTNFLRFFGQENDIGGWRTRQVRSYFAVQLPHRWWLWGIDIQFDSYVDKPQLDYFRDVADNPRRRSDKMLPGDKIILATAMPSWVLSQTKDRSAFENLDYFERKIIRANGGDLALTIAGDLHHYARYEETSGRVQRITSGGGGAYLYPTHHLPQEFRLTEKYPIAADDTGDHLNPPEEEVGEQGSGQAHAAAKPSIEGLAVDEDPPAPLLATNNTLDDTECDYALAATYPAPRTSKHLRWSVIWKAAVNNRWFAPFLGAVYWLLATALQVGTPDTADPGGFLGILSDQANPVEWFETLWTYGSDIPTAILTVLLLLVGLIGFAKPRKAAADRRIRALPSGKIALGTAHTVAHLVAFTLVMRALAEMPTGNLYVLPFAVLMVGLGGLVAAMVFGLYLALADRFVHVHGNEAFSAQAIPDYKNFVRMHLDGTGTLTVYAIGIDKVPRAWKINPDPDPYGPQIVPDGSEIAHHLIDGPITIGPPESLGRRR